MMPFICSLQKQQIAYRHTPIGYESTNAELMRTNQELRNNVNDLQCEIDGYTKKVNDLQCEI
jgi:uncharacterized protein YlxW (UPF0749 family)